MLTSAVPFGSLAPKDGTKVEHRGPGPGAYDPKVRARGSRGLLAWFPKFHNAPKSHQAP